MKTVNAGRFFVSTLLLSVVLSIISPLLIIGAVAQEKEPIAPLKSESSLQFVSDGYILNFSLDGYIIASTEGMLHSIFINSNDSFPISGDSVSTTTETRELKPLTKVTYGELWDGVTVTYESDPRSILKSTYYIDTPEQVRNIRLSYNRPVEIDANGNLVIKYENGTITEEAPIAWQETEKGRTSVKISYTLNEEEEIGFYITDYTPGISVVIDPALMWNTFLGGAGTDRNSTYRGIILDGEGNIYISGNSTTTWGSPIMAYTSQDDVYVAKFGNDGDLIWNTFHGGGGRDFSNGIVLDSNGYVYITGYGDATWGTPIRPYSAGNDAFVIKLSGDGNLIWNTFLGGGVADQGYRITIDNDNNVYVNGYSASTWGTPIRAYAGGNDGYIVKLDNNGNLLWNTFLGGGGNDTVSSSIVDNIGNIYATGQSSATWGAPLHAYNAGTDIGIFKLANNGTLLWNTFWGSAANDQGLGIQLYNNTDILISGTSAGTWGTPIRSFTLGSDAYVAKFSNDGSIIWNTFLGGGGNDSGYFSFLDESGNMYVVGNSTATWGSPFGAYTADYDASIFKLGIDGSLIWNTFLGGSLIDTSYGVFVDNGGNLYTSGHSASTWSSPINPYTLGYDAFIAKIDDGVPATTDDISSSWFNSDVTVDLTCLDNTLGSGCLSTYYTTDGSTPTTGSPSGNSFVLSSQGVYTVKYFSVDNSTNTETVKTAVNTVNIDKTDPTGSISIDAGATYTDTTNVTLTLTATDDLSGMNQMKVSEDPLFTGVPWEAYNASKGFTLSGGDGVKTVYVMYQDLATNESVVYSDTITLDQTGPTGSITIDAGATYTNSLTTSLSHTADDGSGIGVNEMMISDDPAFAGAAWEAYNASSTFTVSAGDGVKTIYIKFRDTLNNEGPTYNDTITLDQTGPTGSVVINSGDTYTNSLTTTLTISATDATSSVDEMMISEDPGFAGGVWEAYAVSKSFTLSAGDGVKTVYIKFKDILGNEGGSYNDTITLDTTGPTGSLVINASDTYTHHTTVTLTINATDVTSSVDEMMVSESPTFIGGVWEAYDTSIWFDMSVGDGVKTIYIKFKDILGNEGGSYSDTITLDQTNPIINITDLGLIDDVPDQGYLAYYFTSQTPFIQGMTEANSTVYYVYGSNTYTTTADGTGHYGISIEGPSLPRTWVTLKYHAEDLAGNLSAERTLVLIVGIENFPQPEPTSTPSISLTVTPSITTTVTPTITITEIPQTGDITPTPILPTIVIYKIEDGAGTLLIGAIVTIDGQQYVSDDKGQIYVQGRPDANPMVTIEYNGEVLSANISGSNITAGEAISQSTNIAYLFLALLMILLAGGGYWIYKRNVK